MIAIISDLYELRKYNNIFSAIRLTCIIFFKIGKTETGSRLPLRNERSERGRSQIDSRGAADEALTMAEEFGFFELRHKII